MPTREVHRRSRLSHTPSSGRARVGARYRLHVRQKIAAGIADIQAGRIHSHESIRREFGLDV